MGAVLCVRKCVVMWWLLLEKIASSFIVVTEKNKKYITWNIYSTQPDFACLSLIFKITSSWPRYTIYTFSFILCALKSRHSWQNIIKMHTAICYHVQTQLQVPKIIFWFSVLAWFEFVQMANGYVDKYDHWLNSFLIVRSKLEQNIFGKLAKPSFYNKYVSIAKINTS